MPFTPHIDRIDLPCHRLPPAFDGLTLLHLSDLHVTTWNRHLDAWHDALAPLKPDLLVITGDLGHRSWLWQSSLESLQRLLHPLTPPLGTFFILGNHDSIKLGPALARTLDPAGHSRRLLQNQTVFIERTPAGFAIIESPKESTTPRIALIGIHQHRRIDTDIPAAMRDVTPRDFKLMLLHYPDLLHSAVAAGADVCLAGHTHGGQICWPDGSPLFRHDTLPAAMCTGIHRVNGTWIVVNRGIGKAGVRMRLFCPPQAVQLTLRRTDAKAP
jgi:predicted MPP superfamily phosphohydrolase